MSKKKKTKKKIVKSRSVSTSEAAKILGVHYSSLGRWRKAGRGPAWRQQEGGATAPIWYETKDLEAYKKKHLAG